jgi:hypothetical protein
MSNEVGVRVLGSYLGMNKKLTWYSELSIPLYVELEVIAVGKGKGKPKGPKGC